MSYTTTLSDQYYHKAVTLMPGGVNSPVRACTNVNATPLCIAKGQGSHIVDLDGNDYIDFVLSWGPMILGHNEAHVHQALLEQLALGTSFGAPTPLEVALAERMIACVPGLERVRMVNSGTEATMSCLRLARAATKRSKLIKLIGCYHGHADPFLAKAGSGLATLAIPGTPGVPDAVVQDTLLAPYNDLPAVADLFAQYGSSIACILVEPVACNMGLVLPDPTYLAGLQRLAKEAGALLLFDEVITGFRLALGGAQEYFGITPDLATFGKIIGGGLPVGAFGGRKDLMDLIAPEGPVYQAGTLSGNPLAMAAGLATITELQNRDYQALAHKTAAFAKELHNILAQKGVPIQIPTIASMFGIFFCENTIRNFSDVQKADPALFATFYKQMRSQGIYLAPSPYETAMVSFAHTEEDMAKTLDAAAKVRFA
ncbi:MAG: glutamate-1-semialdehyde 2,1-aminomutase [Desulfovibrio sp.]|nr:glutamate-1-semialdehyde 2,1-aminomutase [Desulfovibrio sp.]